MASVREIEVLSANVRIDILETLKDLGYGHLGGSFSIVELLSVLYLNQMRNNAKDSRDDKRDRLVLSKGHAGPALYATLANLGYFDKEELKTLNCGGTNLPSHPDKKKTIGIDATTGSLGQGISVAAGMALALRQQKKENDVYAIVGDGELNEGQCWEAFQFIAHQKLSNCIVIIDDNKKQLDGLTDEIMNQFSIEDKMKAFGFKTLKVKGNDIKQIDAAISFCKTVNDQAVCIVLDSIKGQGIPYFEELADNHSVKFNSDEIMDETLKAIEILKNFCEENEGCSK